MTGDQVMGGGGIFFDVSLTGAEMVLAMSSLAEKNTRFI
jgi:hypothetical protein